MNLKEVVSADVDLAKTLMQAYMAGDDLGYTFHGLCIGCDDPQIHFSFHESAEHLLFLFVSNGKRLREHTHTYTESLG